MPLNEQRLRDLNKTFRVISAVAEGSNKCDGADLKNAHDLRKRILGLGRQLHGRPLNPRQRAILLDGLFVGNVGLD